MRHVVMWEGLAGTLLGFGSSASGIMYLETVSCWVIANSVAGFGGMEMAYQENLWC
jgi:hypothetical protein